MQDAYAHCEAVVRAADKDRYLAALFAPAGLRPHLHALHAFNSEIARVRDAAREALPGEIRLQWWREALAGEREGEASAHPVTAALRATLAHYGFVATPLFELIDAHSFDLYDEPMATVADLELYAIRTQSPLFAMAAGFLAAGRAPPETFTLDASVAITIGKILSDLPRHTARQQLYVPLELLDRHHVTPQQVFAAQVSAPLLAALAEMRALARRHLAAAQAKLAATPADILPAFLPLATVGPTLRRMDHAGYDPFRFEPMAPWRRQWMLWRAARDPRRIF
jgi:phytoene synthase